MITEIIFQTLLAGLTLGSTWLTQDKSASVRKWAPIVGLIAQPMWLYVGVTTMQWGIIVLTVCYTVVWIKGFYTQWMTYYK